MCTRIVRAVMLRRGKNKYIVVGDTAAGLWLLLTEFNFACEEFIHLSDGIWARMIFMQLVETVCSRLVLMVAFMSSVGARCSY